MRDRKVYHDPDLGRDKDGKLWITFWRAPERQQRVTAKALKLAQREPALYRVGGV